MRDNFSNELIRQIEINLKKAIHEASDDPNLMDNCEQVIVQKVNSKITSLSSRGNRLFAFPQQTEIKSMSYNPVICNNGVMTGEVVVKHCEKQDIHRYGGPGYPGKENGQLCEYPKGSRRLYKWDNYSCKWKNIYHSIDRGNGRGQSWSDRLTNNAAFEPWWGNNNSGGNYLRSDRYRNGADDLWGDPKVRSYMGTFKQISADVMQSIYRFTLNLKSAIGHYERLGNAFGFGNEESNSSTSNNNEVYTAEEEPKVKIRIKKLNNWHYFMNNGHIDKSGSMTIKDTTVYVKDVNKVQLETKKKNVQKKREAREDFDSNN